MLKLGKALFRYGISQKKSQLVNVARMANKKMSDLIPMNQKFFSQSTLKLDNPYTGEQILELPFLSKEEQHEILVKAKDASKKNRQSNLRERKDVVRKIIKYLQDNKETIAVEITSCMGKPVLQSRQEIDTAIERCNALIDISEEALAKEVIESNKYVTKYLGTVLILSSFDFPILSAINHMIPALLCGNSVLIKDNPRTPIFGEHFQKASENNWVQSFLANQQDVKLLYQEHAINYVVFMGSLESAHDVYQEVAKNDFIDVQLDLDMENAAEVLLRAAFYNAGQSRNSMQRIYIEKAISNDFINLFSKMAFERLQIGDPMDEQTDIGPLAQLDYIEKMEGKNKQIKTKLIEFVADAVNMGGALVLGGNQNTDDKGMGRFFEPTIIANATNGMKVQAQQIFGPIVTFQEVESDVQAKDLINASKYGVTSAIFTSDEICMDYFIGNLKVGVVNINKCPVMQDHYLPVTGRKVCGKILYNSKYAFDNFTRLKSVNIRLN
ncbi:aldehyde dehydrogenase [Stylonychia lemnae]|uniref:Aldehyde dehydrogenase n=1 Tax=Stylonychia lemnae TaxID=5949 RepID=A0A078A305_STYLE|nr:aldehyde dehydrogenase [Stylonychia lemnae]|eukprot:CDW75873.1 aldehyde dehydrogenase [Stylonychia lemnae]